MRTPDRDQAVSIARAFHEAYEGLASSHGWSTNPRSRVPWEQVPEENRSLMLATIEKLLALGVIAGPLSVMEGWWHPNVKGGQVHEHPENPNGNWSAATHRLCEPVYTHRETSVSGNAATPQEEG
jgi:hypothetical protein